MLKNIWIARHGHRYDFIYPEWFLTAKRRYDPSLSDDGIMQAKKLAMRLQAEKITHIFSSPFRRCLQTAYPLAAMLNLPIKLERGLGEWLNQDWMTENPELHPPQELSIPYPLINWDYNSLVIPEYPESETTVINRVGETIRGIIGQYSGSIFLVGHSITIVGVSKTLLNREIEMKPSFGSLTKLTNSDQGWQIELNCDIFHL